MSTICNLPEESIVRLIEAVKERVIFVSPGISDKVASAIVAAWSRLGQGKVSVILDMDPEIYRLGYGDQAGLDMLKQFAEQTGELICHQPGVRICILVCDDQTWVFSPTPLLVETGSCRDNNPNAIFLGRTPTQIADDLGIGEDGASRRTIGLDQVPPSHIDAVKADLRNNPPVKFDLARKVRVFNSQLEFVEFELHGCFVSRKTADISADLMGLTDDEATRDRLRSTFKLLDKSDVVDARTGLSEKTLQDERKRISDSYLTPIKGFGVVILRANKAEFEKEVATLLKMVEDFKSKLQGKIGELMAGNADKLTEALFPSIKSNWPQRWRRVLGPNPSESQLKTQLRNEILSAFGSAADLVKSMTVSAIFKGVTYETLTDSKFLELAQAKFPQLHLMEEYDAAREAGV